MKAFKPDGSRWFSETPAEVMDRWLEDPELQDWFARTVELCDLQQDPEWIAGQGWAAAYLSRPVLMVGAPSIREQRTAAAHYALLRDCLDVALASLARSALESVAEASQPKGDG